MGFELADLIYSKEKPLSHLRVAITALDLEQSEHRGIAYLSKALITSLSDLGAEVYLLTGFSGRRLNSVMKRSMSSQSVSEIDCADIVDQLCHPITTANLFKKKAYSNQDLDFKSNLLNDLLRLKKRFHFILGLIPSIIRFYLKRGLLSGQLINLYNFENSPYFGEERVDYLTKVSGFLCIKDVYHLANLRSRRLLKKTPNIDLRKLNIDFLITSCPLCIDVKTKNQNISSSIQLIMDFIPLSFSKHPDHPYRFYNRLKHAMKTKNCFISKETRDKISFLLEKPCQTDDNNIIYPMPSININKLKLASRLNNIKDINNNYILFNSSVVPRKNLHFLINIFQSSGIASKGFDLCVAGKIHDDKYGASIKSICQKDSSIKLLDYVDETEKAWLFLNAHAFVSPSCVEGFGIPVLDAATLGLRVLVSDLPSHKEIQNLIKTNTNFRLLDLSNIDNWISEFTILANLDLSIEDEIQNRLLNYDSSLTYLKDIFESKIIDLVT